MIEGSRVPQEKALEKQGADFLGFFRSLEDITQVANVQRVSAELFD